MYRMFQKYRNIVYVLGDTHILYRWGQKPLKMKFYYAIAPFEGKWFILIIKFLFQTF